MDYLTVCLFFWKAPCLRMLVLWMQLWDTCDIFGDWLLTQRAGANDLTCIIYSFFLFISLQFHTRSFILRRIKANWTHVVFVRTFIGSSISGFFCSISWNIVFIVNALEEANHHISRKIHCNHHTFNFNLILGWLSHQQCSSFAV